jgi:hypothetical protein
MHYTKVKLDFQLTETGEDEERFGRCEANELSGYRKLDLAKLFNASVRSLNMPAN